MLLLLLGCLVISPRKNSSGVSLRWLKYIRNLIEEWDQSERCGSQVEEDKDDDDDHIILEIEEHRGAGSIFGQYVSFIGINNLFLSLVEELDVSQIVYPGNSSALKWSRP
ncbi:hypothetical protein YC2023_122361 [Brassica napus]